MDLKAIQAAIAEAGLDGWLLFDFANREVISYRILGLDEHKHTSRRWYYYIPAKGEPQKVVSTVEPGKLDSLPGKKNLYLEWEKRHATLKDVIGGANKVAMQYSPLNNIPYVSTVDAGTLDLIRSFGVDVVSSADLIQKFEGLVDENGFKLHQKAGKIIHQLKDEAFAEIEKCLKDGKKITEYDVQQFIANKFADYGMTCDDAPPIVGVNEHAADPHFDPNPDVAVEIKKNDLILIDLWARVDSPEGIYYDVTWMGYAGKDVPARYQEVWEVVSGARDRAVEFEREKFAKGEPCFGWEVDKACRDYIRERGLADYFVHRTGHSIGREVHGNAAHIDNLETKDERQIVPGILHSIEPGVYLYDEKIGVRSEVDVYVNADNEVIVTGEIQKEIIKLDC